MESKRDIHNITVGLASAINERVEKEFRKVVYIFLILYIVTAGILFIVFSQTNLLSTGKQQVSITKKNIIIKKDTDEKNFNFANKKNLFKVKEYRSRKCFYYRLLGKSESRFYTVCKKR